MVTSDDKWLNHGLGECNTMPQIAARAVSKTPEIQGGDACLQGTRVPVWVLVNCRRLGMSDAEILRGYPSLTSADLEAAWAYAAANHDEIDSAIQENEKGESGFAE
jgi:uncharacterized protein (DUF433 family)